MAKNVSGEIEAVKEIEEIKQARLALANLILKTVEEINNRRVQKPEAVYNSLANIYTAIKEN